jgi:glycosyltransferase involved in cell wall biosynthesis
LKILVVHEVDYLEKVIYEIHEFPEMLARAGHDVTFFQFQEGAGRSKGNRFRNREISGRVYPESLIQLVGPHQFGFPSIDRFWATLSCIPALFSLFHKEKFDVVLNYAVPTYGMQVLALAKLFKVPVVHRSLDVSHELRGVMRTPILVVEKILYKLVDYISANNPAMKKYCDGLSGRLKPTLVNYPPLDLKHFSPGPRDQELCTELGISPADKVITYMGSFFYFSGLPEVIRAFATQVGRDASTKLLLIGGGEQEKELLALVSELKLNHRVIFTGFVPYVELPKYLRISDVAINPLKISTVASVAFPHKVLQYLATGLPVVSSRLDGLVAALDGIQGLSWVDSPEECMSTALEMIRNAKGPIDMNLTEDALDALFAPESALKSLTETLSLAISNQTRK